MVALTGLVKASFTISGTYIIDVPSKLINRGELVAGDGSIDLPSLVGTGIESGEPNAAGYTDTIWYEIPVDAANMERLRILLDPAGSVAKVSAYWSSVGDPDQNIEPTFASLTLIQTAAVDQTITLDSAWQSIYVQVGLNSGPGTGMNLTWGDADPGEGGTFSTAYPIDDEYGFQDGDIDNAWLETGEPVPAGISPVRSIWFSWTTPTPVTNPMTFTVTTTSTAKFSIAAYTGSAVNALTPVTNSVGTGPGNLEISFAPATAGTIYSIQVASEGVDGHFLLSWETDPDLVEPADTFEYISVRAYDSTGDTMITELKNRKNIQFQESLNTPGMGSVSIPMKDNILSAYPNVLADGNIIKFFFGNTCVSGFRIQQIEHKVASSGEFSERLITVSGPTLLQLLDDFIVTHENHTVYKVNYGLGNPSSKDERTFSWASGTFPGFNSNQWSNRTNCNKLSQPPDIRHPNWPYSKRPRWGFPKKWPDKAAQWMWISQSALLNENHYKPPRKISGHHYYRKNIVITAARERVRFWSSSDNSHEVWLDGEKIIESNETETGYKTFQTFTTWLPKGRHSIAVFVLDKGNPKVGDGVEAFLFSCASLKHDGGTVKKYLARSNHRWRIWQGPNPPQWKRAEILSQVMTEARTLRSNNSALNLNWGFSNNTDSNGRAWKHDNISMVVKVGTSALDLQSQLSESGQFDVWVDAGTMTLNAAPRRGRDRSRNVALDIGYNLGEYTITSTNRVKNKLLIQYAKGLTWGWFPPSINKYGEREGYVELGGARTAAVAKKIVSAAARYVSESDQSAGSPDVVKAPINEPKNTLIGVHGAYPFLDFGIGDIISAPGTDGYLKKHRVISLSCTESDDGVITFEPDLEPWLQ